MSVYRHGLRRLRAGHLRHAMHYVNAGLFHTRFIWDFYLIGDYGLTAMKPIGTNGMKPSLESMYYYLWMIEEARSSTRGTSPSGAGGSRRHGDPPQGHRAGRPYQDRAGTVLRPGVGRPIATQDEARALYNIT